jgi:hypothetical protein
MIQVRHWDNVPPPPPWLDPNLLGAETLVRVPAERVLLLEGGPAAVWRHLDNTREIQPLPPAYVACAVRGDNGMYVYSRQQFEIATVVFFRLMAQTFEGSDRGDRLSQFARILIQRLELQSIIRKLDLASAFTTEAIAFYMGSMPEGLVIGSAEWISFVIERLIKGAFDIHEYAVCAEIFEGQSSQNPAVQKNQTGDLLAVIVPNTFIRFDLPTGAPAGDATPDAPPSAPRGLRPPSSPRRGRSYTASFGGDGARPTYGRDPSPPRDMMTEDVMTRGFDADRTIARPPEVAPPRNEILRRTPHLDLSETSTQLGQTFQVEVYTDEKDFRANETGTPIIVIAPADQDVFELAVWLVGSSHFEIVGSVQSVLEVKRSESASKKISFNVKVVAEVDGPVPANLRAHFSYRGRPCGSVCRDIAIQTRAGAVPPGVPPTGPAAASDPAPRPSALHIDTDARPADIIVVVSDTNRDGRNFHCQVTSRHVAGMEEGKPEPWVLPNTAASIVNGFYTRFKQPGIGAGQQIAALRGAGQDLFSVAPEDFRNAYWAVRKLDINPISISIISNEPYIPWELMVPHRGKGPHFERDEALGVSCNVGRWATVGGPSTDPFCLPPQLKPLSNSWVFAPKYPPAKKPLKNAPIEVKFVKENFEGDLVTPGNFDGIEAAMASGGRSLFHFICHGESRTDSPQIIRCEDDTTLSSTELAGMDKLRDACVASRPLVFMNACEVGLAVPALIGLDGFAAKFIDLGASCVVAPLWAVSDDVACEVAIQFYEATLAEPNTPFSQILSGIRAKAYEPASAKDTYAAYCFYGDPLARRS